MTDTFNWSLKRLAWAYGTAERGSDEEKDAKAALIRAVLLIPKADLS